MKKTYINPATEIVEIASLIQILAGSLPKGSEGVSDESKVLSRRGMWDDEEDY